MPPCPSRRMSLYLPSMVLPINKPQRTEVHALEQRHHADLEAAKDHVFARQHCASLQDLGGSCTAVLGAPTADGGACSSLRCCRLATRSFLHHARQQNSLLVPRSVPRECSGERILGL